MVLFQQSNWPEIILYLALQNPLSRWPIDVKILSISDHLNSSNLEAFETCVVKNKLLNYKCFQTSSVQKHEANNLLHSFIFFFFNIKCILLHKSTTKLNFEMMLRTELTNSAMGKILSASLNTQNYIICGSSVSL